MNSVINSVSKKQDNQIKVYLFKQMTLIQQGNRLALPSYTKAKSLLAYLLLHHHHQHHRLQLVNLLWPDIVEKQGRRQLRQLLWDIKQSVPDLVDYLIVEGDFIYFNTASTLQVDAVTFKALLHPKKQDTIPIQQKTTHFQEAIQLYTGELLTDLYEDWVLEERRYLQQLYERALNYLLKYYKGLGQYQAALNYALALTKTNNLAEDIHREVMRLYVALNEPESALRHFEQLQQLLHREMGLTADRETVDLAQYIITHYQRSTQRLTHLPPGSTSNTVNSNQPHHKLAKNAMANLAIMVGRDKERATLQNYLQQMRQTHRPQGGLVILQGVAGIGKTHLLETVANDADWHEIEVLWGRSLSHKSQPIYSSLLHALTSGLSKERVLHLKNMLPVLWLNVLQGVIPELRTTTSKHQPSTVPDLDNRQNRQDYLIEALSRLLISWGQLKPLLLILEDVHYSDVDTLNLLTAIGERLYYSHVLIIISTRPRTVSQNEQIQVAFNKLLKIATSSIVLNPLTLPETTIFIQQFLQLKTFVPVFAKRVYQETGGNPLFILELLRTWHTENILQVNEAGNWFTPFDETTLDYTELPRIPMVEEAIGRRLNHLSPTSRTLLNITAVMGTTSDVDLLEKLTELPSKTLIEEMQQLHQRNFLQGHFQAKQFSHDKIRQVVYDNLAPQTRKNLHQKIGYLLQEQYQNYLEDLAHHFLAAESWNEALTYCFEAGKWAQARYAYKTALKYYQQTWSILVNNAATLTLSQAPTRYEVLKPYCALLRLTGAVEAYIQHLPELLATAKALESPADIVATLFEQAKFLFQSKGDYQQAKSVMQEAMALIKRYNLNQVYPMACQLLGFITTLSNPEHAASYLEQAVKLRQGIPQSTYHQIETYARLASVYGLLGEIKKSKKALQTLLLMVNQVQDPLLAISVNEALSGEAMEEGNYYQAQAYLETALQNVEKYGLYSRKTRIIANIGVFNLLSLRYNQALTYLQQAQAMAMERQNHTFAARCDHLLGVIYWLCGDYKQAVTTFEQALNLDSESVIFQAQVHCDLGRLYLSQGKLKHAESYYRLANKPETWQVNIRLEAEIYFGLGLLAYEQCNYHQAKKHLTQASNAATSYVGRPDHLSLCRAYLGLVEYELGDQKEGLTLTQQAVTQIEPITGGLERQVIFYNHYYLLNACGKYEMAERALNQAYSCLQAQLTVLPNPDWNDKFLAASINAKIIMAYQAWQTEREVGQLQVMLAHQHAPMGRPLAVNELITVTWTIKTPGDKMIKHKVARRRYRLQRLLTEAEVAQASATVEDLAAALKVSSRTIKRDLAALRKAGVKVRTRGKR